MVLYKVGRILGFTELRIFMRNERLQCGQTFKYPFFLCFFFYNFTIQVEDMVVAVMEVTEVAVVGEGTANEI